MHAQALIMTDIYSCLLPILQDEAAEMIDDLVTPTEVKLDDPSNVL
jgi:hypothetical protein